MMIVIKTTKRRLMIIIEIMIALRGAVGDLYILLTANCLHHLKWSGAGVTAG